MSVDEVIDILFPELFRVHMGMYIAITRTVESRLLKMLKVLNIGVLCFILQWYAYRIGLYLESVLLYIYNGL